jgi:hypothetical protein
MRRIGLSVRSFLVGLVGCGLALTNVLTPSAHAIGSYNNASIADVALRYVGQYGGAASVDAGKSGYTGGTPLGSGNNMDGECRAFVNAVVWIASGHTQWIGGGTDYFSRLAYYGTRITDVNSLVKGDVVQIGQGTHTFIIVSHVSGSTFNVVDSNEHYDHMVSNYNRSVALTDTERAYRLGSTSWPAQPANPHVVSTTGTTAVLAWTDASNNEESFTSHYRIGTGAWVAGPSVGANNTTMTVTGLTRGTSYTFQVGAHNAKGTHWSAYFYGRTVALPALPTSVHVTSTTGYSAALAWADASNNETSFVSQYKIGSGAWVVGPSVGANSTSMTISGLRPATSYTFQVGAHNVAGTHWSAYAYGTTHQVLPAQPTGPHVTGTTGYTAGLAWTDASNNESSFVSQYKIGSGSWVAGPTLGANATSVTVTGLHSGTAYTFQVGAHNSVGTHWSTYFYGTTVAFPAQPTNPHVASTSPSSAVLAWTDASNNETAFVSQYKIGGGSWVAGPSVAANVTSMTIGGLSGSTAYTFQIGAQNTAGTHWSAYAYGTTQAPVHAPGQPGQPVAGTPDATHISVSWPGVPGAASYELQWTHLRTPGNSDWTYWGSTAGTSVTIGVTTGQSFMFQVRAVNTGGSSSWSQWSNWVFTTVAVTVSQYATGGDSGHTCPYNSCPSGPTYPANHTIWIRCYVQGQNIQMPSQWGGYWTTVWDLASDGLYYSDAWLHTGSNNPVVPACGAGDVT